MSVNNLKTSDQLHFYLKSNGVDINDYKYNKDPDKNKYGIEGIKPLENPYLWNHIVQKNLKEPIQFLINYKKEWVSARIVIAILTGNAYGDSNDCLVPRSEIVSLLRILKENTGDQFNLRMEDILILCCGKGNTRIMQVLFAFVKNNDVEIRPISSFMVESLSMASKTGNLDLIEMIVGYFPETLEKCGNWPFLNAMKRGLYETAVYFVHKGIIDIHDKNDLGYRLLKKNDDNKLVCIGKNKEAHDYLVSLYEKDKEEKK